MRGVAVGSLPVVVRLLLDVDPNLPFIRHIVTVAKDEPSIVFSHFLDLLSALWARATR
jgi:hypothetical protein